jgi:hypothetical protein
MGREQLLELREFFGIVTRFPVPTALRGAGEEQVTLDRSGRWLRG